MELKFTFARKLRKTQTEAEKYLWSNLRAKQINGYRFRRQQPIGQYIVDFICFEKKLIIELDGGQHNTVEGKHYDDTRTEFLQKAGYTVLRFWDNEILLEMNSVLERIYLTLTLSSKGEGT